MQRQACSSSAYSVAAHAFAVFGALERRCPLLGSCSCLRTAEKGALSGHSKPIHDAYDGKEIAQSAGRDSNFLTAKDRRFYAISPAGYSSLFTGV